MNRYLYKTLENFADMIIASDEEYLTELLFVTEKNMSVASGLVEINHKALDEVATPFRHHNNRLKSLPAVVIDTVRWLDIYFSGEVPDFTPPYRLENATEFRKEVLKRVASIPHGETTTYGKIAKSIAKERGIAKMSARAVGSAVGWNPICIIIPCHRVIGSDGSLTGYGGGMENKISLLKLEGMAL